MRVDILKKLIELACNNSNEHEANSAARRACRMIKDDNFNVLTTSQPVYEYTADFDLHEILRRAQQRDDERARQRESDYQQQYQRAQQTRYPPWESPYSGFNDFNDRQSRKPSKERTCSKCGLTVKTFHIRDEPFVCGACQWGDYKKNGKWKNT